MPEKLLGLAALRGDEAAAHPEPEPAASPAPAAGLAAAENSNTPRPATRPTTRPKPTPTHHPTHPHPTPQQRRPPPGVPVRALEDHRAAGANGRQATGRRRAQGVKGQQSVARSLEVQIMCAATLRPSCRRRVRAAGSALLLDVARPAALVCAGVVVPAHAMLTMGAAACVQTSRPVHPCPRFRPASRPAVSQASGRGPGWRRSREGGLGCMNEGGSPAVVMPGTRPFWWCRVQFQV